jgi:hypothetical protein
MYPKSLNISRAVSNFYGTEFEIWVGFWASWQYVLKKNLSQLSETFDGGYFMFSWPRVQTKKLHKMKVKKSCFETTNFPLAPSR